MKIHGLQFLYLVYCTINQLDTKISDIQTLIDNSIQFNDEGDFIDEEDEP